MAGRIGGQRAQGGMKAELWRLARHGRRGAEHVGRVDRRGVAVWAHEGRGQAIAAGLTASVIATVAWVLDVRGLADTLWPLWALAAVCGLAVVANLLRIDRFELDPQTRRWRRRSGWGARWRDQSGPYEELAGLRLEALRIREGDTAARDGWILVLEYADGMRFEDLSRPLFDAAAARREAETWSQITGLPIL